MIMVIREAGSSLTRKFLVHNHLNDSHDGSHHPFPPVPTRSHRDAEAKLGVWGGDGLAVREGHPQT